MFKKRSTLQLNATLLFNGFSKFSVTAFKNVKFASLIGGLFIMIGFVLLLYPIAEEDYAPLLYVWARHCPA